MLRGLCHDRLYYRSVSKWCPPQECGSPIFHAEVGAVVRGANNVVPQMGSDLSSKVRNGPSANPKWHVSIA
eukprot:12902160-Prorocentrum_lima.AAC.1